MFDALVRVDTMLHALWGVHINLVTAGTAEHHFRLVFFLLSFLFLLDKFASWLLRRRRSSTRDNILTSSDDGSGFKVLLLSQSDRGIVRFAHLAASFGTH